MLRFDIVTVVPDLLQSPLSHSIMKRAQERNLLEVHVHNLRDYTPYKHGQVDDYQFGGGAGMVMMCEPLANIIEHLQAERTYDDILYMSPDGVTFNQGLANQMSLKSNIMIICGHYKGIDQRIRDTYITGEISIGDYVLSGGEIAAAVIVDAVGRLIPGVLNDETSALTDSFQDGLLAPPVYTRPRIFKDQEVPEILLSGHAAKIEEWRYQQAVERTKLRRPDMLD
jgi:tRNA (guanine37-N1)-methyltransferase